MGLPVPRFCCCNASDPILTITDPNLTLVGVKPGICFILGNVQHKVSETASQKAIIGFELPTEKLFTHRTGTTFAGGLIFDRDKESTEGTLASIEFSPMVDGVAYAERFRLEHPDHGLYHVFRENASVDRWSAETDHDYAGLSASGTQFNAALDLLPRLLTEAELTTVSWQLDLINCGAKSGTFVLDSTWLRSTEEITDGWVTFAEWLFSSSLNNELRQVRIGGASVGGNSCSTFRGVMGGQSSSRLLVNAQWAKFDSYLNPVGPLVWNYNDPCVTNQCGGRGASLTITEQ